MVRSKACVALVCVCWSLVAQGQPRPVASEVLPPGFAVQEPITVENLVVFPITASVTRGVGPITNLNRALAAGQAVVREVGVGGSGEVNKLVIDNRGSTSIFVLAGTIVKGGNQDRQIGQDFVVGPHQRAAVDAYCVEQGRWDSVRGGEHTGGRFGALEQLATSEVRAAGQYQKDQSQVWSEVARVNAGHGKRASSGTLLATLDDAVVRQRRDALAERVARGLAARRTGGETVGMAYAVDGQIRGVRWFANGNVFALFSRTLANTAAVDALTAQAKHGRRTVGRLDSGAVVAFLREVEQDRQAEGAEEDTRGANVNEVRKSKKGARSRTRLKAGAGAASPAAEVSVDYVAQ